MREGKADGGFPDLNKDGKTSYADVLVGRGVDLERENKTMGGASLMVPPEREQFVGGSLAKVLKAVFKPKTKQGKNLSKKLQEAYEPEDLEEAVKELVAVVEANTQVNKKGKADLKITKSNLVTEASNNLASKDVFVTTNALEDILKLDNIREGSGGKTDNLYDSIIQLAASKLEEPSLMGQFVGDIAGASTRGDRSTAVDTALKVGTAGALLSNLDRLPQSVQNFYSALNPTEQERLEKEFGEAFKKGLDEFIFIDDEGNERPIAVKLAADDNPDVVYERVEKGHGGSSGVAILMPAEYEEPPKDTYNNISSKEEKEQVENMNSDGEMEEEYLDYVADEVLTQEEQDYLFKALDKDNKLEEILDKVMLNATEFTGSGEVDGPGTGVSDSIPARLSDGEFVFTRKATDQIGADKLQKMMDDAERKFDQRNGKAEGGMPEEESDGMERYDMEKDDEEVLERQMAYANRMPSLMNR